MRVVSIAVLSLLSPLAAAGAAAAAQEIIPDEIVCRDCTIELEPVRAAGDRPGFELLDQMNRWITSDSVGRLWVSNQSIPTLLQVFDGTGRYEEFTRPGVGPGEFTGVSILTCFGDGFVILDRDKRFSRLDPATGQVTFLSRSPKLGIRRPAGILPVSDSLLWISSPSRDPDLLGYPILAVNPFTGLVEQKLGKEVDHYDRMVERHSHRRLTMLPHNRILATSVYSYDLRIYADDGTLLRHFVREAEWFPPQFEAGVPVAVMDVAVLGAHRVAVFIYEREPGYEPRLEQADGLTEDQKARTIVEILDLRQGRVLSRRTFSPFVVGPICPTGEIAALVKGDIVDHLQLYSLEFVAGG